MRRATNARTEPGQTQLEVYHRVDASLGTCAERWLVPSYVSLDRSHALNARRRVICGAVSTWSARAMHDGVFVKRLLRQMAARLPVSTARSPQLGERERRLTPSALLA